VYDRFSGAYTRGESEFQLEEQYAALVSDHGSEDEGSLREPAALQTSQVSPESWILEDDDQIGSVSPVHFKTPGEAIAFGYWVKFLSGVIPAYDSAQNPYRRLSKLALSSLVLLNTIISLATEGMYCQGHMSAELTIKRRDLALSSLRESLVA
jgi:hypothetical protein